MRFRLAEALGQSEQWIRENISGLELLKWQLLEFIQPWGQKRADYRAAVICWMIANANYSGKGRQPQLKDFIKLFNFDNQRQQFDNDEFFIEQIKKLDQKK